MLNSHAQAWIEARGIDVDLAVRLGIESCKLADGGEAVRIPFLVGADAVNHKTRAIAEKRFFQDAGATQCFWNFNAICDVTLASQPLIITEGEFDAIAAIQCGYVRAVSVPAGAPKDPIGDQPTAKYAFLEHAKAALRDVREIILATDGDDQGIALMHDLALRLGKARCKWLRYPKGCKDLNDALRLYGERGVHETLKRAEWIRVDGIYRMSELPPYPVREALSTHFPGLDAHYRVRRGDFVVVTGVPGHGKTTWMNDFCCRMAAHEGWVVAICSAEQHPQADHRRALREWFIDGPERQATAKQLADADGWIDRHFVFIVPGDDDLPNLAWVLDKVAAAVVRYGASMAVIDPWNELDHDRPPDVSLTEYTGKAIKEFKRLARALDVHMVVVAHPTKLQKGDQPGLYHISDSAHWANKPDVGVVVWKPDITKNACEVRVVKSRYHDQIGRPGTVCFEYEPRRRRFVEAADDAGLLEREAS